MNTIFEQDFVDIHLDTETSILYAIWKGFFNKQKAEEGCQALVNAVKTHQVTLHLSDQSNMKVLSAETQRYLVDEAFPALEAAGLRKTGAILSADLFAQASVKKINTVVNADSLMEVQQFGNVDDCLNWLMA